MAVQGVKHHAAKMTDAKVRQARKCYDSGRWTVARLAKKYGLTWPAMHAIVQHRTWKHVT